MSLLEKASLIMTPNAVKASKLYSIVPSNGNGDMDVVRATTATRVNSLGLIENVASNVARLNYEGDCPSLLLEPQRTNLFTYSEDFSNAIWAKSSVNITPNSIIAPDGNLTADLANGTSTVQRGGLVNGQIKSIWARSVVGAGTTAIGGYGDLSKYQVTLTTTWQRFDYIVDTAEVGGSTFYAVDFRYGTLTEVYLWGAQLEQGAYPTSYIPTVASTVTRNADLISKTGISDLIGQTEGVLFVESAALANDLTNRAIGISDGTGANRLYLYYSAQSNAVSVYGHSNGVGFNNVITYFLSDTTQFAKIAIRYNSTNISLWVNGVKRGTDLTSQALPINLSRFGFDSGSGGSNFYSKTKQAQLYKTYLTDTEMANLTTL